MYPNYNVDLINQNLTKCKKIAFWKLILNPIAIIISIVFLIVSLPGGNEQKVEPTTGITLAQSFLTLFILAVGITSLVFSILQWVYGARAGHTMSIISAVFNIFGSFIGIGPIVSFILDIIIVCTIKKSYISENNPYKGPYANVPNQNPYNNVNQQHPQHQNPYNNVNQQHPQHQNPFNNFQNNGTPAPTPAPESKIHTMEQEAPIAKKQQSTTSRKTTTVTKKKVAKKKITKKVVAKKKPIKKSKGK